MRKPLVTSLADLKRKVQKVIICTDENIRDIIKQEITQQGLKANLNHLDISRVTSLYNLFEGYNGKFNGDISKWDTSNVRDMSFLFGACFDFRGDISKWDTSNVRDMNHMFYCSHFNGDISKWNVGKVENMEGMFEESQFNQPIGDWDVRKVMNMKEMFRRSQFNQDISKWKINPKCDCGYIKDYMFDNCPMEYDHAPSRNGQKI